MPSTIMRAAVLIPPRPRGAHGADALTERSLSFLVRHAHRAFVTRLADRLLPYDVSVAEWAVLRMLWQQEGLTQVSLAERMRVQKASLTSVLNSMARKGLMRRTRRGDDRRKRHLFLTARGRSVRATLLPIGIAINQRALVGIDPEHAALAADVLEKLIANLETP
jgi:MarR family transcriptional regulator, organic hydroperoxide resistance regulator